jgi:hypothetical protein
MRTIPPCETRNASCTSSPSAAALPPAVALPARPAPPPPAAGSGSAKEVCFVGGAVTAGAAAGSAAAAATAAEGGGASAATARPSSSSARPLGALSGGGASPPSIGEGSGDSTQRPPRLTLPLAERTAAVRSSDSAVNSALSSAAVPIRVCSLLRTGGLVRSAWAMRCSLTNAGRSFAGSGSAARHAALSAASSSVFAAASSSTWAIFFVCDLGQVLGRLLKLSD